MSSSVTCAGGGDELVADLQLREGLAERVGAVGSGVGALDPAAGDGGEEARGALDGGALHVVLHAADAAHLLAAAGAAGAAVDEDRQGASRGRWRISRSGGCR